ncbi:MAG: hypothetical protein H6742_11970 [Alphaproteobacteria bacterium]|nr:hypothetical protein [Alphaproteobacteria bacterium]
MVFDPSAPYADEDPYLVKGIQPDFWADPDAISGNMAGSVAMNLVWAHWQPTRAAAPCGDGQVAYDGWCFTPQASVDAAITEWTARGLSITAVVYGVPEWARTGRDCSPAAPGFEIFCAPDDPDDYATFAGMIARRYNGANGLGRVSDFVVHNEVNSNTWYDVGCGQGTACDADLWLDTYAADYVAAFDAIRAEQDHAKVFLSLDHHFGSPDYDQPSAYDALLAGQTVIEAVAAAAGTRDWRVAYHPYPPNLLSPDFSPDDWPLVTYGNLGALVGWLHATFPGSAAASDVHLTESGINSLSGSSQSAQAAGVCDSFRSVLGTPGIRRYIYHRMQDHPDETATGLGVGLWGSDGVAKAAWSTWALANRFDLDPPQLSCGFEDLPYTTLTRSYASSRGHWASSRPAPDGFSTEQQWRLWREEQPGTSLLYECAVGAHNLLTPASDCEGLLPMGPVGWIHDAPTSGAVALYRCIVDRSGDHFVSPDPGCEGQTTERLLGYALE